MQDAVQGFSILVCEDDEISLQLVSDMLSRGFPASTVYAAKNGQMGLDLFKAHLPQVVVTDVQMPLLDGVQMCSAIQRIAPEVKTIIVSAYGQQTMQELTDAAINIDHYFLKPLVYRQLFGAIKECMGVAA